MTRKKSLEKIDIINVKHALLFLHEISGIDLVCKMAKIAESVMGKFRENVLKHHLKRVVVPFGMEEPSSFRIVGSEAQTKFGSRGRK